MATIPVGTNPAGVSVSPDGRNVYVTNYGNGHDSTVSVISAATNNVIATITVGLGPEGVSISPDGSKLYVAITNAASVCVINTATNTVTDTIAVGHSPDVFGNFISIYPSSVGIAPQRIAKEGIEVYPNPFTDKTTLQFILAVDNHVHIDVYNLTGKLIQTLYEGDVSKNQKYSVEFDGKTLPTGVYIYKMTMNNNIYMGKMILIKE